MKTLAEKRKLVMRFFYFVIGLSLCFANSGCEQPPQSMPPSGQPEIQQRAELPGQAADIPKAEKAAVTPPATETPPTGDPPTFLFVEGRYVKRPYVLTTANHCLMLNGESIFCVSDERPKYYVPYQPEPPELPTTVGPDTSWADIDQLKVEGRKESWKVLYTRYFVHNFDPSESVERLGEACRKLPFVAHVEIVPVPEFRDRQLVRATSKAGDVREFMTTWWDPALRDKVYGANVYPPATLGEA